MRCLAALTMLSVLVLVAGPSFAAGVPLPAGPSPIDPGFGDNVTYTRVLHVATSGSDSSGDGSEARPYASLNRALQLATPGTKVVIHEGTYTGYTYASNLQGTAAEPILVTTAPGEGPVILDRLASGNEVMHLTDAAYVIFENIVFRRSNSNGINIDDGGSYATPSHHIILRNITVEDIGTGGNNDGIKLSGVDNIYILGCLIRRIDRGSGIDMVGCHDSVIAYNEFHDMGSNSVQTKGGSRNVLILGNLLVRGGSRGLNMGGSTGAAYFRPLDAPYEAKDIRAIGNVFKDTTAPIAFVSLVDGVAANNVLYMPSNWVVRILNEATHLQWPQNGRFFNNIIYFRRTDLASTPVNVGPYTLSNTFTFENNLWYAIDTPGFSGYTNLPTPEINAIYQQDPQFLSLGDPAGVQLSDDFRLRHNSPARSYGLPLAGLGAAGQLESDRDARLYLDSPTLGAYEIGLDGDINGDRQVNVIDLLALAHSWTASQGDPNYNFRADFDDSGQINVIDLLILAQTFGTSDLPD